MMEAEGTGRPRTRPRTHPHPLGVVEGVGELGAEQRQQGAARRGHTYPGDHRRGQPGASSLVEGHVSVTDSRPVCVCMRGCSHDYYRNKE